MVYHGHCTRLPTWGCNHPSLKGEWLRHAECSKRPLIQNTVRLMDMMDSATHLTFFGASNSLTPFLKTIPVPTGFQNKFSITVFSQYLSSHTNCFKQSYKSHPCFDDRFIQAANLSCIAIHQLVDVLMQAACCQRSIVSISIPGRTKQDVLRHLRIKDLSQIRLDDVFFVKI